MEKIKITLTAIEWIMLGNLMEQADMEFKNMVAVKAGFGDGMPDMEAFDRAQVPMTLSLVIKETLEEVRSTFPTIDELKSSKIRPEAEITKEFSVRELYLLVAGTLVQPAIEAVHIKPLMIAMITQAKVRKQATPHLRNQIPEDARAELDSMVAEILGKNGLHKRTNSE